MRPLTRLALFLCTVAFLTTGPVVARASAAAPGPEITVFKDPNCGCCSNWVAYLRKHGYRVVVHDTSDLDVIKRTAGITDDLASCHTAFVNGYVIEGHVPVEDIDRLLREKPKVAGLAVPGMPSGSPGMEGGTPQHYVVVAFMRAGGKQVFARH
jgi:hypothetical protein